MSDVPVDAIPAALKEREQWVCWRSKRPIDPKNGDSGSHSDPATWGTFRDALDAHRSDGTKTNGIGYVFSADGPISGVDLDDCRDPDTGEIDPWAVEIVQSLDSFTEVSPSGTGLHIYVFGSVPDGGNKKGNVELYDETRFFTVTGQHVPETPTDVRSAAESLATIHEEHIGGSESDAESHKSTPAPQSSTSTDRSDVLPSGAGNSLSDSAVVAKAKAAANGQKFRRLWNGNTSGYPTPSEADLALCNMLAWWTNRDRQQIDRLFRKSGLYRSKWDERRYSDGRTYGEGTIDTALRDTDGGYLTEEQSPFVDTDGPSMATADGGKNRFSVRLLHSVFDYLSEHGPTGTADVADRIGYSDRHTLEALDHLESGGWVEWEKDGSEGYWTVVMEP